MRLLLSAAAVLLTAGCVGGGGGPSERQAESPEPPRPARTTCGSPIATGPLPEWAREGFTGDASMPHVMGDRGEIVAAIFGHPLSTNKPQGQNNKILWVPKKPPLPGDLVIVAKLDGTGAPETRNVRGGPGPSILDLPKAGCWRLTLTWPEHVDTMDLVYG
ncbi:MAG TPA: hypothetical protein VF062_07805 [Candidatus Limnocylindrales bacterium]